MTPLWQFDNVTLSSVPDEIASLVETTEVPEPSGELHVWDKWVARSGLQKCIRRGLTIQAVACARRLLAIDGPYLWRALNIIALEDVGVCDPNTVTWTRCIMMNKPWVFSKATPHSVLDALVTRMARADKSRLFCEVSVGMDMGSKSLLADAALLKVSELYDAAVDGSVTGSYAALAHLSNKLPMGMKRNPCAVMEVRVACLKGMVDREVPSALKRAGMMSFEKPTDSMALAAWGCARHMVSDFGSGPYSVEPDDIQPGTTLQGLPSATWDMHTQHGKIALRALYTSLGKQFPVVRQIDHEQAAKALGALVFVEEGGMVNRRLTSPWLAGMKEWQDRVLCEAYGCPIEIYDEMRALIRAELPRLDEKRKWVEHTFS